MMGATAILSLAPAHAQSSAPLFDPVALRADLAFLEQRLLRSHPAPLMYCDREALMRCFDSLRTSIQGPMSGMHFLAHISNLYPMLGDGHTMFLPSDDPGPKRYLPLDVACIGERLFVRRNGSADRRIAPGMEIRSINGVPAIAVLDTLLMRQVRDGRNSTYPRWILNQWFRPYYRFSFGEPEHFDLLLRGPQGDLRTTVDALAADSIAANCERNGQRAPNEPVFGVRYLPDDSAAILTIPSFERGGVTSAMIDAAFIEMRDRHVQQLILDLRGNQGGEPKSAKRLLAHLLNAPFELVHKGPASGRTKPRPDAFTGKLVVLMDGGCFSVTGMVLSCLERQARPTFIGEEAGGNRTLLAGSPRHVRLPNTRINCYISTRIWQLADRPNDGHGVMPTVAVSPTIEDIIHDRDPVMEAALHVLRVR